MTHRLVSGPGWEAYYCDLLPVPCAVITAAAIRKVEDEWKRRTDEECRMVREAGDREAEGSHLRVVALKSQLLEVQAKLQVRMGRARWIDSARLP